MKKIYALIMFVGIILSTGCTINHPIAQDYSQYLANNASEKSLPKSAMEVDYSFDEKTVNHRYEFRSATVGYANLWIVEFGHVLDATLESTYVQEAFNRLSKANGNTSQGYLIVFKLIDYKFESHMARISLKISLTKDGSEVFTKTYNANGKSQGGKMFWGGAFAMKNAIQQSTKIALDKVLEAFINDIMPN